MTTTNSAPKDWEKLTPYRHARLRTEMYFGSRDPHTQTVLEYGPNGPIPVETTWVPAVFTCFREIVDNALDEIVTHGHGDRIDITYDPSGMVFTISDNGRGIPINWDETEKEWAATVLLSETMAGRNFASDRGATRGMNGVGASVVNFCSSYFQLEVNRDKTHFTQCFREGEELIIEDAIVLPSNAKKTGTKVTFQLSSSVFHDLRLPENFIKARAFEIALCNPKLKVFYNGERVQLKGVEAALFPNHQPITFEIDAENFRSRFWLVPNFMADGSEYAYSLVNTIPSFNGGVHIDAFRRGFFSGLISALERESKRRKLVPNRSDIADGLLLYNITEMAAPQFDSQSKTRLINEGVATIIRKTLDDPEFFKGVIKKNPEWIDAIYERCALRTTKQDDKDANRLAKKNLRQKVEDLEDACGTDRSKCILFLGEGKSAVSGMTEARDPEIHGGLPLRGKVLNVFGKSNKVIVENLALKKIMMAIGLVPGQRANRFALRYGKIYITTDADEDGKNIAALLVNFFYTLWPELFDVSKPPFIYVFDTPLIIAAKSKQRKYWYNDDYDKFDPEKFKGWEITRAKGLAALKRDDWRHVLDNPKARAIIDDGALKQTLDLLFNDTRADDRKDWIGR